MPRIDEPEFPEREFPEPEFPITLDPETLRAIIEHLGLYQHHAAKWIEATPRSMRRWLAGECPVPPAETILLRLLNDGTLKLSDLARVKQLRPHQIKKSRS